jgi:hypothetical protein
MWAIPLAIAAVLLWVFLRRKKPAPAKRDEPPAVADTPAPPCTTEESTDTATPDAKWRQLNQKALKLATKGDWDAFACALQDQGDQLFKEGRGAQAVDTYCRVLFLQINGATDTSGLRALGETVAPFSGRGFVSSDIYARVVEFANAGGMDDAAIKSKFVEAAAKIRNPAMSLEPAQAWEAIKANRAKLAEEDRIKREARNLARRKAKTPKP